MKCSYCGTKLNQSAKFCANCGKAFLPAENEPEPQALSDDPTPVALRWTKLRIRRKWLGLAAAVLVYVGVAYTFSNSDDSESQRTATTQSASARPSVTREVAWYPAGFQELTSEVAYKQFPKGTADCGYSSAHSCYQIYVTTRRACSLFVKVNFTVNDLVIDDSLDSADVPAGGQAVLTFVSFETPKYEGSKSVKFTEVTCY